MISEVHKATAADAPDLRITINEAHKFKLDHGDKAWGKEPYSKQEISEAIARNNIYAVSVENKPAGSVVLIWEDEHAWGDRGLDGKAGYIHQLATRNAFRGQHLGEQIMDWCFEQIRDAGRSCARLDCAADNTKLCAYYERQGFIRTDISASGSALYEHFV